MPSGPPQSAAPAWTIRAVAVRTRDGPERLDQAYRLLLNAAHRDRPSAGLDDPSRAPAPSDVADFRR